MVFSQANDLSKAIYGHCEVMMACLRNQGRR